MSPTTAAAHHPVPAMASGLPAWGYPAPGPQTLPVFLAPPPPPPLPAGHLLYPRFQPAFQPPPPAALLFEMDSRRSRSLVQFLEDEGAVPTPEEDRTREVVIRKLKKIVMDWAHVVGYEQKVPPRRVTATVLTYGSYTLGAHGPESDIDALCVGPCIATLPHHFFVVLRQILQDRREVSGLQTVENAKVPLMRFIFSGISVDLTYAQLPVIDAVKAINSSSPQFLRKLDSRSWRSLSGVRVNEQIVQLVPNAEKFQVLLRCIKLWARRRGLHCHLLGFFAGIHLAILAAYVCQKYPNATVNGLFTMFFEVFAHWHWQIPVDLHGQPSNCRRSDGCLMPIVMPCIPPELCVSNMTEGTFRKIREELIRGYAVTKAAAAKAPNGMAPEADATVMHHAQWNAHFSHPLPRNAPRKFMKKAPQVVQPLTCEVCKIECDTLDVLVIHETGKKHKKNLQKLQDSITPKPAKPPNGAVGASTSPAAAVANGVMPAIGPKKATPEDLEVKKRRVLEAGAPQGEVKICTLCNVVVNSQTVYEFHIAGHKHKANVQK